MSIDRFRSQIGAAGGLASANRFSFEVSSPFNESAQKLSILCKAANLPGKSISTFEKRDTGKTVSRPYTHINDALTITVHLTNDFYARELFLGWMNLVVNPNDYSVGYFNEYVRNATLKVLNKRDVVVREVVFTNVYPTAISEVQLDNDSTDATLELTITLSYDEAYDV